MNRILTYTTALVLVLAHPAAAERVSVLSGEHRGFTRLALVLPEPSEWEFGRVDNGYELRIAREGVELDVSSVFNRIARRRISDVQVSPDMKGLRIALDCNCWANVFEDRPGLIVIDVREGRAPAASRYEMPLEDQAPVRQVTTPRTDDLARDFSLYWRNLPPLPAAQAEPAATPAEEPAPDERVAQAQEHLVQQIARAAAQGLLEADVPAEPAAPTAALIAPEPVALPPDSAANHLSLRAQSALDRELGRPAERLAEVVPSICVPDVVLDVAGWADGRPMADQLAARRAAVVGEFDAPSATAVGDFARTYLHFGLGAEARKTLAAFDVTVPDADILQTIGQIMDLGPVRPDARLPGMTSCDGAAALWAMLAAERAPARDSINTNAIVQAFSALPLHLRQHLGPQLGERLLAAGERDAAEMIRNAIQRAVSGPDEGLSMVNARLDLSRGDDDAAERNLHEAARDNGTTGAEAHALLLENRLRQGRPIEPALIETTAALGFEHRGTDLGRRLDRMQVLALAASGAFDQAFATFNRLGRDAEAADPLLDYLTATAPDTVFLAQLFADNQLLTAQRPPAVRQAMARRLIDLGFAEAAQRPLLAADPQDAGDRILLAEAAMAMRDPQGALRHLAGLENSEASAIRGRALQALGQHDAAAKAFIIAGQGPDQTGTPAQAGEAGDGTPDEVIATAGPLTLPGPQPDVALEVTLAASRALLEDSRANRQSLEALLQSLRLPELGR